MPPEDYNAADLASVLRTLSSLSNQTAVQRTPASTAPAPVSQKGHLAEEHLDEEDSYEPSDALPPPPPVEAPRPAGQHPPNRPPQATTSQSRAPASGQPTANAVDTSTITTWPAALRHVVRAVSQNEDIQRKVRWLIQRQHDHEKQWWQGREALVKKQIARVDKKKELDEVLRSVGAPVDATKQVSTAEEDQAELVRYDTKVYKASKQMAEALAAELRALQIPFFSIKQSLVVDSKSDSNHPVGNVLSRDEVSAFQRRILELLQDLCKE